MKNKLLVLAFGVFALAGILTFSTSSASAATLTWDGGGSDNNVTTAANWVGDVAPVASDDLVFDVSTSPSDAFNINNDSINTYAGVNFTGTLGVADPSKKFVMTGVDLNATTHITNSMNNAEAPEINVDVFLSAAAVIEGTNDSTVREIVFGNTVTFAADSSINNISLILNPGSVSGLAGVDITIGTIGSADVPGDAFTGFAGNIHIDDGGYMDVDTALSYSWANLYMEGGSVIFLTDSTNRTFTPNITIASGSGGDGLGIGGSVLYLYGSSPTTTTLSGSLTLLDDLYVSTLQVSPGAYQTMDFTGAISGSFTLKQDPASEGILKVTGSSNSSSTPNGTYEPEVTTTTIASGDNSSNPTGVYRNKTLIVNGTRGDIFVSVGGTLKGTGTVGTTDVDGHIAPGLSPGVLNTGDLSFGSTGVLDEEIGGTAVGEYDRINVTGTVDLGGATLTTTHWNGYVPAAGDVFTIINNDASDAITGTFAGLANGTTFTVGGVTYQISYTGGDGNDVTLTVTASTAPTPGTPNTGAAQTSIIGIVIISLTALLITAKLLNKRSFAFARQKNKKN